MRSPRSLAAASSGTIAVLLGLAPGCSPKQESPPAADSVVQAPRPADSLVLSAPGNVELWFTDARSARDSAGRGCVERVMQIRRGGQRIAIPLLYTGSTPRLVNDSTIEAPIWLNCRPGNLYQVDLKTGRPVRVK
jgi:hypothetical protein